MSGTSWKPLVKTVQLSVQFQSAYGIQTAWDSVEKTVVCFTMGVSLEHPPKAVRFLARIDIPFTSHPKLLRTELHSRQTTLSAILAIIDAFPIPSDRLWPISILRRAITSARLQDPA